MVFQQKALNTFDNGFNTYCRFIIETEYGEYDKLNSNKPYISVNEMNQISNYMKQNIIETFKGTSLKMINYYGASFQKINNQVALKISYTRILSSNPPVRVDMYLFENRDRLHRITISYRLSDKELWQKKIRTYAKFIEYL